MPEGMGPGLARDREHHQSPVVLTLGTVSGENTWTLVQFQTQLINSPF